ncbi:MAG TPA: hypothetical protein VIA18_27805, partial [Polyangia bacterium]|nr:hypothetical protein [Polyangia bacterium]
LGREVALLAARSDAAAELGLGDELGRLGDGLERLEAMLARPETSGTSALASEPPKPTTPEDRA